MCEWRASSYIKFWYLMEVGVSGKRGNGDGGGRQSRGLQDESDTNICLCKI